jgi:hypothetical protein
MKNKIYAVVVLAIMVVSCKPSKKSSTEKIPVAANNVAAVQKAIANKTWQVIDVATINGSRVSKFAKPESSTENIVAPNVIKLSWLSEIKGLNDTKDFAAKFTKESFDKYKTISMQLKNDSIALLTGMEVANQKYTLNDVQEDKEPNGIKLKLISYGKPFESMGETKFTATYYVLGINDKMLYLLTPNTLNEEKLVFLLEAK